jgi:hypothetical protein
VGGPHKPMAAPALARLTTAATLCRQRMLRPRPPPPSLARPAAAAAARVAMTSRPQPAPGGPPARRKYAILYCEDEPVRCGVVGGRGA